MKISNMGLFTLGALLALSQGAVFAYVDKPLVCKKVLLESSLDPNEAKKYSIRELMITESEATSFAKLKIQGVRFPREMSCVPSAQIEIRDGFRNDGTCSDHLQNGFKMEVKSSVEMAEAEAKETFVFIRSKSDNRLITRLSCDRPLLRRFLNR